MGDSSDEIPGAPGIRPKLHKFYLKISKTTDGIYAELKLIWIIKYLKPKVKSSLIENKDLVYLSKDIGTIVIDADVPKILKTFGEKKWKMMRWYAII